MLDFGCHCTLRVARTKGGTRRSSVAPGIAEVDTAETPVCWVVRNKGLAEGDTMQITEPPPSC